MSIAIWCLLTKHCGPCHRLAIFSDACRSANYKQTRYTFSDKDRGAWHRVFSDISACPLHLDQALVGFHNAHAAAQEKGCQESDKDRVKFVTVVQLYCHLWGTPVPPPYPPPECVPGPGDSEKVRQPVTHKSQSWKPFAIFPDPAKQLCSEMF